MISPFLAVTLLPVFIVIGIIVVAIAIAVIVSALKRKQLDSSSGIDSSIYTPPSPEAVQANAAISPSLFGRDSSAGPAAPGSAGEIKLNNVKDKQAAMIMAIVAHHLKTPLNQLRFKSIRQVD